MPTRAARPCRVSQCPGLAVPGSRFCNEHQPLTRQRPRPDNRPSAHQRGYGSTWRMLRLMQLRSQPICADPFGVHGGIIVPATDVDHIVPRSRGGEDVIENLQSLCHSCHSMKTRRENHGHDD